MVKHLPHGLVVETKQGEGLVPARELEVQEGRDLRRAFPIGEVLQVVLLDASRVAVALGSIDVSRSSESSIWMVDELDSNPELVGLFQAEASALKIVVTANWLLMDAGACRVLTGCDWAPAV